MPIKRYKAEQIVTILRQIEVGIAELEQQLSENQVYAMKVSAESSLRMGFKV